MYRQIRTWYKARSIPAIAHLLHMNVYMEAQVKKYYLKLYRVTMYVHGFSFSLSLFQQT